MRLLSLSLMAFCLSAQVPVDEKQRGAAQAKPEAAKEKDAAQVLAEPVDPKTFILGPEDVLAVRVWREPELSAAVMIRPDGRITLPLAGEVQAGGLTPEQLGVKVAEALSKYLNRPEVSVSVTSVQSKKYCITGKVNSTGCYPLVKPLTVLDALTISGGLQEFAKQSKIVVARGAQRIKFNYKEVLQGKKLAQNIVLQPGDYIIVP